MCGRPRRGRGFPCLRTRMTEGGRRGRSSAAGAWIPVSAYENDGRGDSVVCGRPRRGHGFPCLRTRMTEGGTASWAVVRAAGACLRTRMTEGGTASWPVVRGGGVDSVSAHEYDGRGDGVVGGRPRRGVSAHENDGRGGPSGAPFVRLRRRAAPAGGSYAELAAAGSMAGASWRSSVSCPADSSTSTVSPSLNSPPRSPFRDLVLHVALDGPAQRPPRRRRRRTPARRARPSRPR